MTTGSLRALVGKFKDRIFGIVVEKTSGLLSLHFLVRRRAGRRRSERLSSERLPSEPEPSSESAALVEGY